MKDIKYLRIIALASTAGEWMIRRGGTYDVPEDVANDYIKAGHATLHPEQPKQTEIQKKPVAHADETTAVNPDATQKMSPQIERLNNPTGKKKDK